MRRAVCWDGLMSGVLSSIFSAECIFWHGHRQHFNESLMSLGYDRMVKSYKF